MTRRLRAIGRLTHFTALVALSAAVYLWRSLRFGGLTPHQRAEWLHQVCTGSLKSLGVEVQVTGPVPSRGLIVSNHLSYLDILVYSAIAPVTFVSKHEVGSWPIFGWMARRAGTIFIKRERRSETQTASGVMESLLDSGLRLVLFPEGTSSDGRSVLRFHSSLFDAAIRRLQPVTAAHIAYSVTDGDPATDVCYWGDMTLVPHMVSMARIRRITAHVQFAAAGQTYSERKQAAATTHAEVVALAGLAAPPRLVTD
jgi:lyso-ornithine lipid O-acyltransferase